MASAHSNGAGAPGTVIVTGGASGLGAAVVHAVSEAGGTPVVLDLKRPAGGAAHEHVDLADARAAEAAVRRAVERHGGIDGVVTAAGVDACGKLEDVDARAWERVIAVNLVGTAAVVRASLPSIIHRGGRVVTVASTLGLRALSDASAYCASKFGIVGFTRALALEAEGRFGVTLLVPGGMQTAFFDDRPEQYRPGPEVTLAPPGEVAHAVLFALTRPTGLEIRELTVTVSTESSWP